MSLAGMNNWSTLSLEIAVIGALIHCFDSSISAVSVFLLQVGI